MYGHLVFPIPCRYFPELAGVCEQLLSGLDTPLQSLYVVSMKRGYLLENCIGEFAEFEPGDRFLFIEGSLPWREDLFADLFPMPETIMQECLWEGIDCGICHISIDDKLQKELGHILAGLNTCAVTSENDWVRIERFESFLAGREPAG